MFVCFFVLGQGITLLSFLLKRLKLCLTSLNHNFELDIIMRECCQQVGRGYTLRL